MAGGRLGFELGTGRLPHVSPADFATLRTLLPNATFVDASDLLHAARAIKSAAEIALVRRSVDLIVRAFQAVCQSLRPGLTEIEMTRIASAALLDAGGEPDLNPAVFIFMAGKERYRSPLLPATDRALKPNELVSLDGGCSVRGYHSDFARAAVLGEAGTEVERQFDATVQALMAAESVIGVGRPLGDAWSAAQSVLEANGLGEFAVNPLNIGHSIGLDHWERPTVSRPDSEMGKVRARAGMVLCVEPQVAGTAGDDSWSRGLFLVEDQLLVGDQGVEILTADFPRDLYITGGP